MVSCSIQVDYGSLSSPVRVLVYCIGITVLL